MYIYISLGNINGQPIFIYIYIYLYIYNMMLTMPTFSMVLAYVPTQLGDVQRKCW